MTAVSQRLLSGQQLRALSQRSDRRGALQLSFHLLLIVGGGVLVALAEGWLLLPAMLLLGLAQAALFAPLHETMHLTAFASRRANAVAGWLVCCPSLLNWHFYAAFHLAHHRHTQDPERDPELALPPPGGLGSYLARVATLPYWKSRLLVIADAWRGDLSRYPYIPAHGRARVIRSVRAMSLFVVACALASAFVFGWATPLLFWIGPQLLGQPFLRLYLLTEHTLCSNDDNGLTNTRTTLTNPVMRLLMWNMGFHTEHHLYPSIPFHRLPDAHLVLRERLEVLQRGYVRWHLDYFRQVRRGQA